MKRIARKKAAVTVDEKNPGLLLFLCHYPGVPRQVMSKWYILRMHVILETTVKLTMVDGTIVFEK